MLASRTKLLPCECNFVAQDAIWKNRVHTEVATAKRWPQKWAFTTQAYTSLLKELHHEPTEAEKSRLPSNLRLPPITPIENYIKVFKSPPYPDTTTCHIGWRAGNRKYSLEIYGPYARPKGCIYKTFNWPLDAI